MYYSTVLYYTLILILTLLSAVTSYLFAIQCPGLLVVHVNVAAISGKVRMRQHPALPIKRILVPVILRLKHDLNVNFWGVCRYVLKAQAADVGPHLQGRRHGLVYLLVGDPVLPLRILGDGPAQGVVPP